MKVYTLLVTVIAFVVVAECIDNPLPSSVTGNQVSSTESVMSDYRQKQWSATESGIPAHHSKHVTREHLPGTSKDRVSTSETVVSHKTGHVSSTTTSKPILSRLTELVTGTEPSRDDTLQVSTSTSQPMLSGFMDQVSSSERSRDTQQVSTSTSQPILSGLMDQVSSSEPSSDTQQVSTSQPSLLPQVQVPTVKPVSTVHHHQRKVSTHNVMPGHRQRRACATNGQSCDSTGKLGGQTNCCSGFCLQNPGENMGRCADKS